MDHSQLAFLARLYGTDKVDHHEYTRVYHELLRDRRERVHTVVEIGVGHPGCMWPGYRVGASLFAWRDYFPHARIYGLDINRDVLFHDVRITCLPCDQSDAASLLGVTHAIDDRFDFVVDDGSHVWEHQLLSAQVLLPRLRADGLYVIEDVHVPPETIIEQLPAGFTATVTEAPGKLVCECGCGGPEKLIIVRRQ